MNLEKLIVRLQIKEENKGFEKKKFNPNNAKENVMEYGQSSKNKKNQADART